MEMITGKDLLAAGWESGAAIGAALQNANKLLADGVMPERIWHELGAVYAVPASYIDHSTWSETANELLKTRQTHQQQTLRAEPAPLSVWGEHLIDPQSYRQINDAARLPVTLKVALMPDAHVGYGLPIGGIAALEGAIAPYMVGVDIGCRMHATIFDRNPIHLDQATNYYQQLLMEHTFFGRRDVPKNRQSDHPVLDDPRWALLPKHLQNLQAQAKRQLGSSGGGNHFVEWTKLTVAGDNPLGLDAGKYIALVSHSGSRGVGFKIANYYSKMAKRACSFLPKQMQNLGYLDYAKGEGQEYESAMSLAGDFARANHETLHARFVAAMDAEPVGVAQNHHNYAWRVERANQSPVFIHRKGATPASQGVTGIIPGSMATPGFFVEGACYPAERILEHPALNSTAHGSGRRLGRKQAIRSLSVQETRKFLNKQDVVLLGGGLDEAPKAYKNSRDVIAAQTELVRVWAEFMPKIVRMAADRGKSLGKRR